MAKIGLEQNIAWQVVKWAFILGTVISIVVGISSCSPSKYKRYTVKYHPYTLIFPDGHSITVLHPVIDSAWTKK